MRKIFFIFIISSISTLFLSANVNAQQRCSRDSNNIGCEFGLDGVTSCVASRGGSGTCIATNIVGSDDLPECICQPRATSTPNNGGNTNNNGSSGGSTGSSACGAAPYFVPDACPDTYQPDFDCQKEKILNPGTECCPNICPGEEGVDTPEEFEELTSIFNNKIGIKSGEQIPTLINLAVTTLLGIASVYALVMGVYIAGFVRARSTDESEIAKANKTLGTLIAGFLLAWSFIFIIQIVANFLGLGSLSNLELVSESDADVIIID